MMWLLSCWDKQAFAFSMVQTIFIRAIHGIIFMNSFLESNIPKQYCIVTYLKNSQPIIMDFWKLVFIFKYHRAGTITQSEWETKIGSIRKTLTIEWFINRQTPSPPSFPYTEHNKIPKKWKGATPPQASSNILNPIGLWEQHLRAFCSGQ